MKKILFIFIFFISQGLYSDPKNIHLDVSLDSSNLTLNAHHYDYGSNTVAIILHGMRGHRNMEIVNGIANNFIGLNIDSLIPNLSYGINSRNNDFLPCDIKHSHVKDNNIKEVMEWWRYANERYDNIILVGHSMGGQDILSVYKHIMPLQNNYSIKSIMLFAPSSQDYNEIRDSFINSSGVDIEELKTMSLSSYITTDFLGCKKQEVKVESFLSYYDLSGGRDTVSMLSAIDIPTYIFLASEDTYVPETAEKLTDINKDNIQIYTIEGSDHFFRDLYLDDVLDIISGLIE